MTPKSAAVVPGDTNIPAMKAHAVTMTIATPLWLTEMPPANTASAQITLDASIRFARCRYGPLPSEYATLSAPLATLLAISVGHHTAQPSARLGYSLRTGNGTFANDLTLMGGKAR